VSGASSSRIGLLRGGVVLAIGALVAACQYEDVRSFQGYAQGETIRLSAPYPGNLSNLAAKRGAKVTEGTTLFSLADESEVAANNAAKKRLAELQTRPSGAARDTEEIERLKTQVAQTQLKLAQKSANAPADAVVVETLYAQGDWVPAGAPVVAILLVDKITVRFAVPLAVAAHLQNGRSVTLICERCGTPVRATVTYISPFAQPKSQTGGLEVLRYMVEARPNPAQAALLKPGQPVTVVL
jgi:multidrug efflux pump subunit AcrA (membrane-fusion protein)